LIFHKNEHYWKKDNEGNTLPYLDGVQIHFLTDKKQAYRAFLMGNLDYITGIEPNSVDEIFNPDGTINKDFKKRYDVEKITYLNTEYLGFQLDKKAKFYEGKENHPFLNKRFRKALSYAIDRERLIKYLRNNVGLPANYGIVPPPVPNYDSEEVTGYSYDPDKALRLFKESGVQAKELKNLSVSCTEEYKDLIEFVTKQWEDVLGVTVRVDITGASVYYSNIKKGEAGFFRASWLGDYPDAENYLTLFYSQNFAPNGPNKTHYSNYAYDQLYRKGINEPDVAARNLIYQEADQLMMLDAPVIPLFYDEVIRLKQKNITNFPANAMNLLRLEAVIKQ
jgi:peptide/nickel transport system substrate-binding protein